MNDKTSKPVLPDLVHAPSAPTSPIESPIQRIVEAALTAPSGDNCQPWRFHWDGTELKITLDEIRAKHDLNRANHASLLSLGCVLESISIAASHEKWHAAFRLNEDLIKNPGASVSFNPAEIAPDDLLPALSLRATDRRKYKKGFIQTRFTEKILNEAAGFESCRLYFQNSYSKEFLEYVISAEGFVWEHQEAHRDFFQWIRFSDRETEQTRDGMSWRNLGINYLQSRVMKLCRNFNIQKRLNSTVVKETKANMIQRLRSSAGLGCITVTSMQAKDLVQAGQLWMRAWLRFNLNGYGVQPLTSGAFPIYDSKAGVFPENILPQYKALFAEGFKLLHKTFAFTENEIPILLFRTGKSTPLPRKAQTLRLPLDQVLRYKSA